jgi:hypothetical protein
MNTYFDLSTFEAMRPRVVRVEDKMYRNKVEVVDSGFVERVLFVEAML